MKHSHQPVFNEKFTEIHIIHEQENDFGLSFF